LNQTVDVPSRASLVPTLQIASGLVIAAFLRAFRQALDVIQILLFYRALGYGLRRTF
jgi:hypothetical protein